MISKSNLLPKDNGEKSGYNDVTNGAECNNGLVEATHIVIVGRWKPIILYQLAFGRRRFGEIAARIPIISRKMLAD